MDHPNHPAAQVVIDGLRQEHRELLYFVGLCDSAIDDEQAKVAVLELSFKVRMHFTTELGVFMTAIAHAMGDKRFLDHCAEEYATVLALINELNPASKFHFRYGLDLAKLRRYLSEHVRRAETEGGIFDLANAAKTDWLVLAETLRAHRAALTRLFRSLSPIARAGS